MNKIILEKLSNLSKDNSSLQLYINLIEQNLNKKISIDYDLHHILPKSLFPEYENLNQNKWNCVKLSYWDHLEAHRLLSKLTGDYKMNQCYFLMAHNGKYNNYFDKRQKEDYENAKKLVIKNNKGKTCYIDKNGNTYSVSTNDPRVLSGELKHVTTGKISVKDKDGNTFLIDKNDPRCISGELCGVTKGKTMARNLNGNKIQVDKNDPRWLTGEIVGATKGMKPYNNGVINKRFFPGEETEGFVKGQLPNNNQIVVKHSDDTKRKISLSNKGKSKHSEEQKRKWSLERKGKSGGSLNKGMSWYNNGIINKMFKPDNIQEGFIKGKIKKGK